MSHKKNITIKLHELNRGDKFYDLDGYACEFIDCEYDPNNPDKIKYRARRIYHRMAETRFMCGLDAANREYYVYTGRREKTSFIAGFQRAMKLCTQHMGKFDLENAELDNPAIQHLTMLKEYKKWVKNDETL